MAKHKHPREVLRLTHESSEPRVARHGIVEHTIRQEFSLRDSGLILFRQSELDDAQVLHRGTWDTEGPWAMGWPDTAGLWVAGAVEAGWKLSWGAPELRALVRLPASVSV